MSVAALVAFAAATVAHADDARDALAEIAKCADIAESSERLKCFDEAAVRAKSALAAPPQTASEARSLLDWFGFVRPPKPVRRAEDFGRAPPEADQPKELTEIGATVVELAKNARGKALFLLDNGQLWKQIDSDNTDVRDASRGEALKVTIERGVFGSYNLTIGGRNVLIKVNRLK